VASDLAPIAASLSDHVPTQLIDTDEEKVLHDVGNSPAK